VPQRLYNCYKRLVSSNLVVERNANEATIKEFEAILNESQPQDNLEDSMQSTLKTLYYNDPVRFWRYLTNRKYRISAYILWTESKRIVKHFKLNGLVHVRWDRDTKKYVVQNYLPREQRAEKTNKLEQAKEINEPIRFE
jgi:hypothetical protein